MAFKQEVNVPLILTIGIVGGIIMFVVLVGVEAWYNSEEQSEFAIKSQESPNVWLRDLKDGQKQTLDTARWVDVKNHVVAIPIAQAMEIMVKAQGNFPTTMGSAPATLPGTMGAATTPFQKN